MKAQEIISASTLGLAHETLRDLRADPTDTYEELTNKQQSTYDRLAKACLKDIVIRPDAANLLTKLGPTDNAYSIKLAEIDDALLRIHYYPQEGADVVDPAIMQNSVVDFARFGTPHTHYGNISSAVPLGKLIHYCFTETEGQEYSASHITYRTISSANGQHMQSVITPRYATGLVFDGMLECDNKNGYRMHNSATHVISWPEETVTVFFSDMASPRRTTAYQPYGTPEIVGAPRVPLCDDERQQVWSTLTASLERVL